MHARDLDVDNLDAAFPERARTKGMARFRFDMREIFIAAVPGHVADLETYIAQARPDVIVAEPAMAGAAQVIEQRHGIAYATAGIGPLMMRSADTAPFGLGLQPPRSRLGRLRNRALDALIQRTLFGPIDRATARWRSGWAFPYRERAAATRAELAEHGGAAQAADLLEELALSPRPGAGDRRSRTPPPR